MIKVTLEEAIRRKFNFFDLKIKSNTTYSFLKIEKNPISSFNMKDYKNINHLAIFNKEQLKSKIYKEYLELKFYCLLKNFLRKPIILYNLYYSDYYKETYLILNFVTKDKKGVFTISHLEGYDVVDKKMYFEEMKKFIKDKNYEIFNLEDIVNKIVYQNVNDENIGDFNFELVKEKKKIEKLFYD